MLLQLLLFTQALFHSEWNGCLFLSLNPVGIFLPWCSFPSSVWLPISPSICNHQDPLALWPCALWSSLLPVWLPLLISLLGLLTPWILVKPMTLTWTLFLIISLCTPYQAILIATISVSITSKSFFWGPILHTLLSYRLLKHWPVLSRYFAPAKHFLFQFHHLAVEDFLRVILSLSSLI